MLLIILQFFLKKGLKINGTTPTRFVIKISGECPLIKLTKIGADIIEKKYMQNFDARPVLGKNLPNLNTFINFKFG